MNSITWKRLAMQFMTGSLFVAQADHQRLVANVCQVPILHQWTCAAPPFAGHFSQCCQLNETDATKAKAR
eukprot:973181-Amphidinium_carterae.2